MKGITITLQVRPFLDSRVTTRADGARVRAYLVEKWDDVEHFVIDFENMQVASVSFFDEAFGLLAEKHTAAEIRKKVVLDKMSEQDRALFDSIMKSRATQFKGRRKSSSLDYNSDEH